MPAPRLALLLLLLAWPLQPMDDAVQEWMRAHQQPFVRGTMQVVSDRARVALVAGATLGLLAGPAARACVAEAAVALLPVNLAVEGLKWTVNRTRPDGDRNRKNSSFPSSHAANAITVAIVAGRRFRRAAVAFGLGAALVAFSRLYLDRHWLSDAMGAALLAGGGAWVAGRIRAWWESRRSRSATS
jgi:membrane-associated phospholipid phosphatase